MNRSDIMTRASRSGAMTGRRRREYLTETCSNPIPCWIAAGKPASGGIPTEREVRTLLLHPLIETRSARSSHLRIRQLVDPLDLSKNSYLRNRSQDVGVQDLLLMILLLAEPCARPALHHVQKIEYC